MRSSALCDKHAKAFEEVESQVGHRGTGGEGCQGRGGGATGAGLQLASLSCQCFYPYSRLDWNMGTQAGTSYLPDGSTGVTYLQANKSFFSEIIASISDITFSKDGRYILSRDYMTLKLWDLNKESAPVATFHTHEHLRARVRLPAPGCTAETRVHW
jgi:hypothetical protein